MKHDPGPEQRWLQLMVLVLLITHLLPQPDAGASAMQSPTATKTAASVPPALCGAKYQAARVLLPARSPAIAAAPEAVATAGVARTFAALQQRSSASVEVPALFPAAAVPLPHSEPVLAATLPAAASTDTPAPARSPAIHERQAGSWAAPQVRITLAVDPPGLPQARFAKKSPAVPDAPSVAVRRGLSRLAGGAAGEVYETLRAHLAANLTDKDYVAVLAVAALRANRFAEAEVIYRHLLSGDRADPRWWMGLATAQQGRGVDSRAAQQQVLALAAADSVLHRRAEAGMLLARNLRSAPHWKPGMEPQAGALPLQAAGSQPQELSG